MPSTGVTSHQLGMTYDPAAFPSTFALLYCPFHGCPLEEPFSEPGRLVNHISEMHRVRVHNPEAVYPILDRYLAAVADRARAGDGAPCEVGGDFDTADEELRKRLQLDRLKTILDLQQQERQTVYKESAECLFCRELCSDYRTLFRHMFKQHSFNIGQLDNLVMVKDFLSILRSLLESKLCIYCGGRFATSHMLKRHMASKGHCRINSHNTLYDRFYVVNYMLPGQTWCDFADELHATTSGADDIAMDDGRWSDLDERVDMRTACLLCEEQQESPEDTIEHMLESHKFGLDQVVAGRTFYDSVKMVNFMRCCWRDCKCAFCLFEAECSEGLSEHYSTCKAATVCEEWHDPQYLFPFYDDDPLLSILDSDLDALDLASE